MIIFSREKSSDCVFKASSFVHILHFLGCLCLTNLWDEIIEDVLSLRSELEINARSVLIHMMARLESRRRIFSLFILIKLHDLRPVCARVFFWMLAICQVLQLASQGFVVPELPGCVFGWLGLHLLSFAVLRLPDQSQRGDWSDYDSLRIFIVFYHNQAAVLVTSSHFNF